MSHKLELLPCSVFLGALSSPVLSGLSGAPCYLGPPPCSVLSRVAFVFRSILGHSRVSPDFGRCRVNQKYKNANKHNTKITDENRKEKYNNQIEIKHENENKIHKVHNKIERKHKNENKIHKVHNINNKKKRSPKKTKLEIIKA